MPVALLQRAAGAALLLLASLPLAPLAAAQSAGPLQPVDDRIALYRAEMSYEDALFGLEQAVIGAGLLIDNRSHVGEMLARTAADVGSSTTLFENAEILMFCSASLSRKMMEVDLTYIARCPYAVYVFVHPGEPDAAYFGYRRVSAPDTPEDSPLKEIDALLDGIVKEAAGL